MPVLKVVFLAILSAKTGDYELVSIVVEIPSRRFSSSGSDCLLGTHRQLS